MDKYWFILDIILIQVIGEGQRPPPVVEPISAAREGEGVICGDGTSLR